MGADLPFSLVEWDQRGISSIAEHGDLFSEALVREVLCCLWVGIGVCIILAESTLTVTPHSECRCPLIRLKHAPHSLPFPNTQVGLNIPKPALFGSLGQAET